MAVTPWNLLQRRRNTYPASYTHVVAHGVAVAGVVLGAELHAGVEVRGEDDEHVADPVVQPGFGGVVGVAEEGEGLGGFVVEADLVWGRVRRGRKGDGGGKGAREGVGRKIGMDARRRERKKGVKGAVVRTMLPDAS